MVISTNFSRFLVPVLGPKSERSGLLCKSVFRHFFLLHPKIREDPPDLTRIMVGITRITDLLVPQPCTPENAKTSSHNARDGSVASLEIAEMSVFGVLRPPPGALVKPD